LGDGYFNNDELLRVGKVIIDKISESNLFLNQIKSQFEKEVQLLLKIAKKCQKVNSSTSNKILNELFQSYYTQYLKTYTVSSIPFLSEFALENELNKIIAQKIFSKKEQQEYILMFTFPIGSSWIHKSELELLKIYDKKKRGKNIDNDLNKFHQKWSWLAYDFEGKVLDKKHFSQILGGYSKNKEKVRKIRQQETEIERNKILKKKSLMKLELSNKECRIINSVGEISYLKEYRKGLCSQSHLLVEPLLKEIGNRGQLSLNELRFLFPDEIEKFLLQNQKYHNIIKERKKHSVYIQKGKDYQILTGKEAIEFVNNHTEEKKVKMVSKIKGSVASKGIVKGEVKIVVTIKDAKKIKEGDIIVSTMTNPDLMSAVSKASAIITDYGGITCHAAIVSRELGIPCIIGTGIATQILKDDDFVEVNADKGIVTIIKKKKT